MTKFKINYLLLFLGISLFIGLIFTVNLLHFTYKINADIGSEIVLTKLIWDSKEWIPQTWYPSTELRMISTPNISALFYGITKDAILATGLGCCLMTIGIIISISYFMNTLDIKSTDKLLMLFLCLMLPCSFTSLELLYLYASYYATHVISLFLTLGFYHSCIQRKRINWAVYMLITVLALLLGIQGMRGMMVTFGPLFVIEIIRIITIFYKKHTLDKYNIKLMLLTALLLIINYIGTCFPFSVDQNISRNIRNGFSKLISVVLPDVARTIGFEYTNLGGGIILGSFCLLSVMVLFGRLQRLLKQKELETFEWPYLVLAASPVLTIFIVSFTTVESSERYYFILLFMIAMSIVLLVQKVNKRILYGLIGAIILLAVINIRNIYIPVLTCEEPPQSEAFSVTEYLMGKKYSIAYASFENANMMTALSHNKIIVAPIADIAQMNICKWMTSTEWYAPNRPFDEKTVYIITESEKDSFLLFLNKNKYEDYVIEECKIGKYWIFVSQYNLSSF